MKFLTTGDRLPDAEVADLGLPALASAIRGTESSSAQAGTGYATATYTPNSVLITFSDLELAVTDNGANGSASVKLLDVASGVFKVRGVVGNVTGAVTAGWNPTTPVMALGTAAAGADGTLTGTEADVVQSTALTVASDAFAFAPDNTGGVVGLTDSTGGTVSATSTLAAVGATNGGDVSGTINNNLATLAAKVDALRTRNAGAYTLNATASAQAVHLNFACASDPSSGKTITLSGSIRITFEQLGDN